MGTRSGFLGWEKRTGVGVGEEDDYVQEDCDVGLALRMQPNNNDNNSDTTSSSSSSVYPNRKSINVSYHTYVAGDYAGGGNQVAYMGIAGGGSSNSNSNSVLQSSDCFPSNLKPSKSLQHHPLGFSGKMAASGNVRVPFTATQWQELERQNTILKYMMASASPSPVPQDILFPNVAVLPCQPNRSGDPEPWRCRRTDGKKWRCSRDVAPHQKYCERHSHKNRPRSRKPVESPAARRSVAAAQPQQPPGVDSRQALSSHFGTPSDQGPPSAFASPQPLDHPRCLDWFMKGETIPASISCKDKSSGSNIDPFQLKQSSHYSTPQRSSLFLMEGAMDEGCVQHTRRFIDAWSNVDEGSGNRSMSGYSYSPSSGKNDLATSSLTLTMRGGEGDDYSNRMGEKPHWMNAGMVHHGSSMGSPPGGPLAEALCLGSIGGCVRCQNDTTSGRNSNKDEGQDE